MCLALHSASTQHPPVRSNWPSLWLSLVMARSPSYTWMLTVVCWSWYVVKTCGGAARDAAAAVGPTAPRRHGPEARQAARPCAAPRSPPHLRLLGGDHRVAVDQLGHHAAHSLNALQAAAAAAAASGPGPTPRHARRAPLTQRTQPGSSRSSRQRQGRTMDRGHTSSSRMSLTSSPPAAVSSSTAQNHSTAGSSLSFNSDSAKRKGGRREAWLKSAGAWLKSAGAWLK